MKENEESFGPCIHCEYEPTRAFCGDPKKELPPVCDLCLQLIAAAQGMLRMPDFFVDMKLNWSILALASATISLGLIVMRMPAFNAILLTAVLVWALKETRA